MQDDRSSFHSSLQAWMTEVSQDPIPFLQMVSAASHLGIAVVESGHRIRAANDTCANYLGLDASDLVGRLVPDALPLVWPRILPYLDRALTGESCHHELTLYTSDDPVHPRHLHLSFVPQPISSGTHAVLLVVVDKTEQRIAETRSNSERIRLEGIVNSAMDGIVTIDEDQSIVLMNAAAERMFGVPCGTAIGKNVAMLIPFRFRSGHSEHVKAFGRTGVATRSMGVFGKINGLRNNEEEFPLEASISQVVIDHRKLYTVTCRDVTDRIQEVETRRNLEMQLHQSQKMEAFGQLAGGVAHDFNNLLTVISGYSEMLVDILADNEMARVMAEDIHRSGERAASLTKQLLAFSRQLVLEPRVLDIHTVIKEAEKLLRRLIGEDIQLSLLLRSAIKRVKVDPGQFVQVIMNLAVNARDAMPQGGRLTIETSDVELDESYTNRHPDSQPGRFVLVAMSDTGSGMTPEVKGRVFEPFFTTKGVGKGTGLGLAVVHGIIKQSGGNIDIYSEIGIGSTFKIYLPAVLEPGSDTGGTQTPSVPRGNETVLLVEDEEDVRKFAARALESHGYTVLSAAGGESAIKIMEENRDNVALLITDVVMPEMSGRQLAEKLQSRFPGLRVLYLSGYTDDAIVRHGVLQAEVAFLQKPFTPNSLRKKVREVLDQGNARD